MGEIVGIIAGITVAVLLSVIALGLVIYYADQVNDLKAEIRVLKRGYSSNPNQSVEDSQFLKDLDKAINGDPLDAFRKSDDLDKANQILDSVNVQPAESQKELYETLDETRRLLDTIQ